MCVICFEEGAFVDIKNFSGLKYYQISLQNCNSLDQQNLGLISDESYILNTWHSIQKMTCSEIWKAIK